MTEHVLIWDLETVPDLLAVARVHDLAEDDLDGAREALGTKFPKLFFHSICAIAGLIAEKVDGLTSSVPSAHRIRASDPRPISSRVLSTRSLPSDRSW